MPYYIEINKDLYSSVKGASARYKEHLEGHLEWHAKAKKAVWCHQASNRYNGEKHRRKYAVGWVKTKSVVSDQK